MDLPHGRIDAGGPEAERLVALPATWFGEVLEGLSDGRDAFADRMVGALVRESSAALDDPSSCTPDEVAWALSLSLARRGLGLVAFERWGDALVFVWRSAPASGEAFRAFASRLASRLVGELFGLDVAGVTLAGEAAELRIALLNPEASRGLRARAGEAITSDAILALLTGDDA